MTVPLLFMEDKDEKTLSPLEARVAFAGMLDNAEKWAREVWRKNPQAIQLISTTKQQDETLKRLFTQIQGKS